MDYTHLVPQRSYIRYLVISHTAQGGQLDFEWSTLQIALLLPEYHSVKLLNLLVEQKDLRHVDSDLQ